jgi:uncharacterized protein YPO0396
VDERHYVEVSNWINTTHLGGRLVYYRVGRVDALGARTPASRSLVHRLELRDHAHRDWLAHELARRFDYTCVDSAAALRNADRALTREGLVKHGGDRHEKDDRRAADDRRNWVLGFDNRDKLMVYEREGQELAQAIAGVAAELDRLKDERDADGDRRLAAAQLASLEWEEIDVAPKLRRLGDIEDQLGRLRAGDATLQDVMRRLETERMARDRANGPYEDARDERRILQRDRQDLARKREACAPLAQAMALSPAQMASLDARLPNSTLTLSQLDVQVNLVERQLSQDLKTLDERDKDTVHAIEKHFETFCHKWPQDSADFTAAIDSAEGFLARLHRLELDGLPKHESRFFELLQSQSKQNLLVLQKHMIEARKSIGQRMDEVNETLERVPFNRGTLLQIEPGDRNLPEVRQFQQQLRDVLSQHQTDDRERAEAQFFVLRQLVARLAADDPEHRRWREGAGRSPARGIRGRGEGRRHR